jgi:hypothetical protein
MPQRRAEPRPRRTRRHTFRPAESGIALASSKARCLDEAGAGIGAVALVSDILPPRRRSLRRMAWDAAPQHDR